jgi:TetR/AcrR family transcriptional repressor of nem operon
MELTQDQPARLTPKGRATRERIVDAAAQLIYDHGVKQTNNEMIRRAAGVSGSQLSHYFPDKEQLVRAVIARRAESMMGRDDTPPRGPLDSIDALERWAESYIANPAVIRGGCSFGSLASEILKSEPNLQDAIADGFARWGTEFRDGLNTMRDDGTLDQDADIHRLAHVLMAAFQGGMLLTQATGDIAPLRDALQHAVNTVRAAAAPSGDRQ